MSLNQLMIVIGISASFFSNYFLLDVGEHNWRWMLGVQMFPALLYFCCCRSFRKVRGGWCSRVATSRRWRF